MEMMSKLETIVGGWYKNVPHLPKNGQDWLATNVWWLTLIWVVLGALGLLALLPLLALANGAWFMVGMGGAAGSYFGLGTIFYVVIAIVSIVVGALAISPLKAQHKRGWSLLFLAVMIDVFSRAVQFVFDYNLFSFVWSLLEIAVGLYFLYEIRNRFITAKGVKKATEAKKV